MNKKYAVFGAAAVIAIAGVIYFGTGAGQQASILALGNTGSGATTTSTNPKCTSTMAPRIVVTSPNGGEVYRVGQQITVKWTSCNVSGQGSVFLFMPSVNQGVNIGAVQIGANSAILSLPMAIGGWSQMVYGKNFKIEVFSNGGVTDFSDNLFTINNVTPTTIPDVATTLTSSVNTATINTSGYVVKQDVAMDLSITPSRSDVYIPRVVKIGTSLGDELVGNNGFVIVPLNGNGAYDSASTVTAVVSLVTGGTIDPSGRIRVSQYQTVKLRITASITAPSGSGSKAIQLNTVGAAISGTATPISYPTYPRASYRSQYTTPGF